MILKGKDMLSTHKYSFNVMKRSLIILLIILVNGIVYYPSLKGEFTNWDDNQYLTANPNMQPFSMQYAKNINQFLNKSFVMLIFTK